MLDSARQSKSRYSNIKRSNEALRVALAEALARERKAKQEVEELKQTSSTRIGQAGGSGPLTSAGGAAGGAGGASLLVQMRMRKAGAVAAAAAAAAAARKQKAAATAQQSSKAKPARAPWRSGGGIERKRSNGSIESKEKEGGKKGVTKKRKGTRKSPSRATATSIAKKRGAGSRSLSHEKRHDEAEVDRLRRRLAMQVEISKKLEAQVEELIGDLSHYKMK